jgi:hypothetical protein
MVPCDCCRQEKADARPRQLLRSSKIFNICEDCMREMPNPDSAPHRWLDEQLNASVLARKRP